MAADAYEKQNPDSNGTMHLGWGFDETWAPDRAWVSHIDTEFTGTIDLKQCGGGYDSPFQGVTDIYLEFKVEKYDSLAAGAQWTINDNYLVIAEFGFDTVENLLVALNFRF